MTDTRFTEFHEAFKDRVLVARLGESDTDDIVPVNPREIAFTETFLEDLVEIGQIGDCEIAYFEKKLGRAIGKLSAYSFSDDGAQLDLVCSVTTGDDSSELKSIPSSEISAAAKRALHVFRSVERPIHEDMEPASAVYDMVQRLHDVRPETSTIRVVVLVDGKAGRLPEFDELSDLPDVTFDVWDIERLFRASSSGLTYEPLAVDLEGFLGAPLPCLSASATSDDHRCYLAIFPGELLHDLYHEHGPRLLELNVRSFLQARGKVNKGIRDTIQNDPGHFLPYNNGISVTVEELEIVNREDGGHGIRCMKGMQIVNGGQTVASIHRAKDRDKADLSAVHVQAKITVVSPEHVHDLVPMISRYSNTQNKVNETDFSANHPFHVKVQKLSEQVWAPGQVTKWSYERARGQWEVARNREGSTPAKKRTFDQKTPRSQKVDKNLLAKAFNAWAEKPHVVSLGGQKCFVNFMTAIDQIGKDWVPDEVFYKDLIAKVIIFKGAEKIARQIAFSAYRANAVCYTISSLAYRTAERVDLADIWTRQSISENLEATIRSWMPQIHEELVDSAGDRNVTEWCKKKECWSHVQTLDLEFAPGLKDELAAGLPLPTVGKFKASKTSPAKTLTAEERDRQARTMRLDSDEWLEVVTWGKKSGVLSDFEMKIAGTVLGYAAGGWNQVPSPKQTKYTDGIINKWNESGANERAEELVS